MVTIRPARPTHEDGVEFAEHLDIAAEGLFRWMLGPRHLNIVAQAFLAPSHDLSYEYVHLAESRGRVVGMLSGYSAAQHSLSTDDPLEEAAGLRRLRLRIFGLLASPLLNAMDRVPDADWYVQAVAVEPTHRGAGIGSALLDRALQTAREVGSSRIALDVAVDNKGARRLYERFGMAIESRSRPILFIPNSAMYRMVRYL